VSTTYRLYLLDWDDHFVGVVHLTANSDKQAVRLAAQNPARVASMELWDQARFVKRFEQPKKEKAAE